MLSLTLPRSCLEWKDLESSGWPPSFRWYVIPVTRSPTTWWMKPVLSSFVSTKIQTPVSYEPIQKLGTDPMTERMVLTTV